MKRTITVLVIAAVFVISARGQEFLNLDFESAYDLPNPGGDNVLVSVTNALPDWSANYGSITDVNYVSNRFAGTGRPVGLVGGTLALSGDFSAELYLNGSISQTGVVPDDAESLQFEAEGPGTDGSIEVAGFSVSLGVDTLSYSALSEGPDYTVYGANIPADMDGLSEALVFSCQGGSGGVVLDSIEFSAMGVPEPSESALIAIGVILFGLRSGWKYRSFGIRRFSQMTQMKDERIRKINLRKSAKSADKRFCRPVRSRGNVPWQ